MIVVSSKEFSINQDKYFDLALSEQIMIQRGDNLFIVTCDNISNRERKYKTPDDDLRRAITMDEFKERALDMVENIHNMYTTK